MPLQQCHTSFKWPYFTSLRVFANVANQRPESPLHAAIKIMPSLTVRNRTRNEITTVIIYTQAEVFHNSAAV